MLGRHRTFAGELNRKTRLPNEDRLAQIRAAAIELFFEKGYHATSMRDLSERVGIQSASLYHHLPSKQDLLRAVLFEIMADLDRMVRTVAEAAGPAPEDELRAAIRAHILYHGDHRLEAAISDSELRGLIPENREEIMDLRDQYEGLFRDILRRGNETGAWNVHEKLAGFIILSMCTGVSVWYRSDGPIPLDHIADFYADFVLRSLRKTRDLATPVVETEGE